MDNYKIYQSWRDKLLTVVSNQICQPCEDPRKEIYVLDYENPLNCGCYCERVESILENAKKIDDDLKTYAEEKQIKE